MTPANTKSPISCATNPSDGSSIPNSSFSRACPLRTQLRTSLFCAPSKAVSYIVGVFTVPVSSTHTCPLHTPSFPLTLVLNSPRQTPRHLQVQCTSYIYPEIHTIYILKIAKGLKSSWLRLISKEVIYVVPVSPKSDGSTPVRSNIPKRLPVH